MNSLLEIVESFDITANEINQQPKLNTGHVSFELSKDRN